MCDASDYLCRCGADATTWVYGVIHAVAGVPGWTRTVQSAAARCDECVPRDYP